MREHSIICEAIADSLVQLFPFAAGSMIGASPHIWSTLLGVVIGAGMTALLFIRVKWILQRKAPRHPRKRGER